MTEELCRYREWDSQFFGRRIAEVLGRRLSPEQVPEVLAWCTQQAIDCLYFLADPDDAETVRMAEDSRFRLVDIRLTLATPIAGLAPERGWELASVRTAVARDVSALKAVAATGHRISRFYYDGHFPGARCDALYETWIEKSCNGYAEALLVLDVGGGGRGHNYSSLRGSGGRPIGVSGG